MFSSPPSPPLTRTQITPSNVVEYVLSTPLGFGPESVEKQALIYYGAESMTDILAMTEADIRALRHRKTEEPDTAEPTVALKPVACRKLMLLQSFQAHVLAENEREPNDPLTDLEWARLRTDQFDKFRATYKTAFDVTTVNTTSSALGIEHRKNASDVLSTRD